MRAKLRASYGSDGDGPHEQLGSPDRGLQHTQRACAWAGWYAHRGIFPAQGIASRDTLNARQRVNYRPIGL